jgi:ATP sulfurylase
MKDLIKELEKKVVTFPYPTAFDVDEYVKLSDVKKLLEEKKRGITITNLKEKMYSMEDIWKARTFFTKNDIQIGGYTDGYLKLKFINWIKENLS